LSKNFDAWDAQADYFTDFISAVDSYDSILGYEIMNEPHIWDRSQYDDIGAYHTYMAGRIAAVSDKAIIFTREIPQVSGVRTPTLEYQILPRLPAGATNQLMYWPHLYTVPGSNIGTADTQIQNFKTVASCWKNTGVCLNPTDSGIGTSCSTQTCANKVKYDVLVGVGEYATQDNEVCRTDLDNSALGQTMMNAFVCNWRNSGFPHTYWATNSPGYGNRLISDAGVLNQFGTRYVNAINYYYSPTYTTEACPTFTQKALVNGTGVNC
jgi:hypothetical protein